MKILKYILPLFCIGAIFVSCNTNVENVEVIDPYTYSPLYYQDLRDYKASDHSLAWAWFADYIGESGSMAVRFTGLPDSLDIVSLWGGIPSSDSTHVNTTYNPSVAEEMHFVQKTKGMKLVVPTIIRINNFNNEDFYKDWTAGDETTGEKADSLHKSAMRGFAQYLLRPIYENDLDGVDLDYEPEGDPLSGSNLDYFVSYMGKFIGPMASSSNEYVFPDGFTIKGDSTKLLCIDYFGDKPSANTNQYTNLYVNQTYGSNAGGKPFSDCPYEKVIYTENIGDTWTSNCGQILSYATYQPSTGRKGGFGGFYMHRDYIHTSATWNGKTYIFSNYAHLRLAIQLQNPAIH